MSSDYGLIYIGAGGTGGHVIPACVVAQALIKKGFKVKIFTDERGRVFIKENLDVVVLSYRHRKLTTKIIDLIKSFFLLRKIFKNHPDMVISFGGLPSLALGVRGVFSRIPVMIHEQNAVLSKSNRFLACLKAHVALSFPVIQSMKISKRVRVTGNPIRPEILELWSHSYVEPNEGGALRLLILGGSQGASVFSDWIPSVVKLLPDGYQEKLELTMQCRQSDLDKTQQRLAQTKATFTLNPFINNMADTLRKTHLIIARSGSSVWEFAVAKVPAIFIPYPHAAQQHQYLNAHYFKDSDACWLLDQEKDTSEDLRRLLLSILCGKQKLSERSSILSKLAQPHATNVLVEWIENLLRTKDRDLK